MVQRMIKLKIIKKKPKMNYSMKKIATKTHLKLTPLCRVWRKTKCKISRCRVIWRVTTTKRKKKRAYSLMTMRVRFLKIIWVMRVSK